MRISYHGGSARRDGVGIGEATEASDIGAPFYATRLGNRRDFAPALLRDLLAQHDVADDRPQRPAGDEHDRRKPPAPQLAQRAVGGHEQQREEAEAVDRAE